MPTLRDPLPVRSVVLPNRLWFPPIARDLALGDGTVTDENVAWYAKVAGGGVGTVVVEHCFVHPDGRFSARQIGIDRDGCVDGLARIASAIRGCGAVAIAQVSFAGARTTAGRKAGPSAVALPGETERAQELGPDEIARIPGLFESAVRRAREAGFSGVEIHGAHGFLLSEFFSPLCNLRTDGYGGSAHNRARLAIEVVQAARAHARTNFVIGFRFGVEDRTPGGLVLDEALEIARWLEGAGVDILSISGGLCGSRLAELAHIQGYFFPQASAVKRIVSIPVVGVGGITEAQAARNAVLEGKVDLVAVGRALAQDPDWARRALE